ncbi:MAG: hypothetical protein A2X86_00075 [Bdellovibrionales bacterium GWA2_49_15]|nr:MAG: hypothetical protein A2X86_00075 [Bdellovibrionales bacterium GWA2_49_15]HAZ14438.1 macrocin O-methyltransferase [Bdellovibrionales bacterium]
MQVLSFVNKVLFRLGYRLITRETGPSFDMEADFVEKYTNLKPYTLTSCERMYALYKAVEYIHKAQIPGDVVECGVWQGGSCMLVAQTLKQLKAEDRKIYLYDTFEGMSAPTDKDIDRASSQQVQAILDSTSKSTERFNFWAYAPLELVKKNMAATHYPMGKIQFVQGKVEDTIPGQLPKQISLLRLDTDWYESTKHELKHLYPLLSKGGVLIIDDYGHFKGAQQAVDEFFAEQGMCPYLARIDYTCRVYIKNH